MTKPAVWILAIASVLSALARPGAAETRPDYGGTLLAALLSEPVTVDPTRARSHAEVTLVSLVFDTLYRVDGQDATGAPRVAPHLAASMPDVAGDGLTARIAIRPGVMWHDSRPVTPGDVAASLRRLAGSPAAYLVASVRRVRADGDAVVVELSRPTPDLAVLLSAPQAGITPRGRAPGWRRAVGSGPFRLVELDRPRRRVRLAAADRHFAGRPYVDALELAWFERGADEAAAYETGRSHLSLRGAVAYAGHTPKYRTGEAATPATLLVYVGFGAAHRRITGHPEFRRALSLAVDRHSLRGVGTGERVVPASHPVAAALGGPPATDAERRARIRDAEDALARAAQKVPALRDPVAGRRTSFELELLIDRTRPDDREIAEKVVAALFRLGVSARIVDVGAREFDRRVRRGACDLYLGQEVAAVPAPAAIMAAAFASGGDPWAQRRLAAADLTPASAREAFSRRLPVVPLFHRAVRVHHRSNVRGLRLDHAAALPFADLYFSGPARPAR